MYRISEKDLKNIFSIQPVTEGDAVHSLVSYFDSRPSKVLPLRPRSLLQRLARLHCVDFRRISRMAAEFNGISYSPSVFINPNYVFLPVRCVAGEDGHCRIEYYNLAHHFGDYDMRPAEDKRTSYLLYRHKPVAHSCWRHKTLCSQLALAWNFYKAWMLREFARRR